MGLAKLQQPLHLLVAEQVGESGVGGLMHCFAFFARRLMQRKHLLVLGVHDGLDRAALGVGQVQGGGESFERWWPWRPARRFGAQDVAKQQDEQGTEQAGHGDLRW
jgi:hypothetical protein